MIEQKEINKYNLTSQYHCVRLRECVIASQFRWTSKSVERYDGTRSSLMHVLTSATAAGRRR